MEKGTLVINGRNLSGAGGGSSDAKTTKYDNQISGLQADNVQNAIDEAYTNVNESLTHKEQEFKHYNSKEEALADLANIDDGQMVETDDYEASSGDWVELWSGSSSSGSVTLSQPISKYKTLAFRLDAGDSGATFLSPVKAFILDSSLSFGTLFLLFPNYYSNIKYSNDTTIQITRIAGVSLRNVYGMK